MAARGDNSSPTQGQAQAQAQAQAPVVGRKRSHNEITMADPEDSNDSIEWVDNRNNNNGDGIQEMPTASNGGPAPFSHEALAIRRREEVDYNVRFSLEEAKSGNVTRPIRVYADGIYDMFHTGHARQLMQAKMAFPHAYLIVGICSDAMTYKNKGRTVMNDTERYEAVRHCRYVDEVLTDAPWVLNIDFVNKNKIDFVAHDELPYTTGSADDVYKFVKERGMFLPTQRTEGVSTTDVITRIIKDYDVYIRRNLARGYSHKELNVSYMKAKQIKLKDNYEKLEKNLKDKGKNLVGKWKEQVGKYDGIIHRWEERSKEFIGSFVDMFGKEGRLGQWIQENTTRIGRAISPSQSLSYDSPSQSLPYDSPSSPSTSDLDSSSPPHKKGRFSPIYIPPDDEEELSDKEDD